MTLTSFLNEVWSLSIKEDVKGVEDVLYRKRQSQEFCKCGEYNALMTAVCNHDCKMANMLFKHRASVTEEILLHSSGMTSGDYICGSTSDEMYELILDHTPTEYIIKMFTEHKLDNVPTKKRSSLMCELERRSI